MLNLQTIVENLGVACEGRAWVVVTSQEDIDKVLGSLSNARSNDFSKIQGRFRTRLSLSSANCDEVIQSRLIEKKPEVTDQLSDVFNQNADILKNQLTFSKVGMTLNSFKNTDDFIKNYPFIPKGLESIVFGANHFKSGQDLMGRVATISMLVQSAMKMALDGRRPGAGLIHHSNRGVQYASGDFQKLLEDNKAVCSMSRKGNCWDNACVESFFDSLKNEWVKDKIYTTFDDAKKDIFNYVEMFYNRKRRHASLGYVSPVVYEEMHEMKQNRAA